MHSAQHGYRPSPAGLVLLPPSARPLILREWNRLLKREPLPWQERLEADTHRNILVIVGRRGGKTDEAGAWLTAGTAWDGLPGASIAPDYEKADLVFSGAWQMARRSGFLDAKASSAYDGRLVLSRRAEGRPGGIIERRTGDAKSGNVGFAIRRLVWDEVCRTHNGLRLWGNDLAPTLDDYTGEALWITTPAGWDHVHELYQRIKAGTEPDWGLVQGPSWDNHHVYPGGRNDPKILAREKEYEQAGLPELFLQEYGAEFRILTGVILRKWDPKKMVVSNAVAWRGCSTFYLGYDWGFDHPAVWVLLGRSGRDWRVLDEDYGTEEDPERIMLRGLAICHRNNLGPAQIERVYYDPSRPEQGAMFRRKDFAASPAKPYDYDSRIMAMAGAVGRPGGFLVNGDKCKRLPVELSMWRWAQDAGYNGPRRPVKVNEDGVDATAGVLASVYAADSRDQATNDAYAQARGVRLVGAPGRS